MIWKIPGINRHFIVEWRDSRSVNSLALRELDSIIERLDKLEGKQKPENYNEIVIGERLPEPAKDLKPLNGMRFIPTNHVRAALEHADRMKNKPQPMTTK